MKFYHNPRCSKSRQTLNIVREAGIEPEIVEYLKTPVSEEELKEIVAKLDVPLTALIRKGEAVYKEKYKGKDLSDEEWIKAMVANPKMIERPIAVVGDKAVLGRPPENVSKLL
ncbi:MAG: arsenate reductase (glutaredoxin) [Bacteroidota bacterium]